MCITRKYKKREGFNVYITYTSMFADFVLDIEIKTLTLMKVRYYFSGNTVRSI